MDDIQTRQIDGYKQTITNLKRQITELQKKNHRLERDLGIFREEGFLESPSLPLIIIGVGHRARPICEEHGEMLRYEHDIWRCEGCKTSVDLSKNLKWIREEFDGVVVIK